MFRLHEPQCGLPVNDDQAEEGVGNVLVLYNRQPEVLYSSLIEIVVPGVDGILYCKALMPPDDEFNDMRAMMYEKQLTPVSLEAMYDAVPACKPTITSVIVEKKNDFGQVIPDQWTLSSFAAYNALPDFDWDRM
jgi:hypothetical protein